MTGDGNLTRNGLYNAFARLRRGIVCVGVLAALGGCAALPGQDAPRVSVAGLVPREGEGLEMRFDLKLRVQNPNDTPIDFDGVALDLALNGSDFASGVSDVRAQVPRFGETVVSVPVAVSALAATRQIFALARASEDGSVRYEAHGKLGGGWLGGMRFESRGTLRLGE
jgi:LEA14-like dessication related protein